MINIFKNKLTYKQKRNIKKPYFVYDVIKNSILDALLYLKYSNTVMNYYQKEKLEAQLYKECHRIEKGLSLSNMRFGFGRSALEAIYQHLIDLKQQCKESEAKEYASSVVREYLRAHESFELDKELTKIVDSIINITDPSEMNAGVFSITKKEVNAYAISSFAKMSSSRFSVRQYSTKKVDNNLLASSVQIALKTPSVCNRQAFRVRFYTDKIKVNELLKYQNGNKAFRDEIPVVAVVTVDLTAFVGAGERNQAYIDGGLFAMSLVYALHYNGLGTCFLNWSVTHNVDRVFRKVCLIPHNEVIITLISVGHLKEEFKVAASPRRDISNILSIIEN